MIYNDLINTMWMVDVTYFINRIITMPKLLNVKLDVNLNHKYVSTNWFNKLCILLAY